MEIGPIIQILLSELAESLKNKRRGRKEEEKVQRNRDIEKDIQSTGQWTLNAF